MKADRRATGALDTLDRQTLVRPNGDVAGASGLVLNGAPKRRMDEALGMSWRLVAADFVAWTVGLLSGA